MPEIEKGWRSISCCWYLLKGERAVAMANLKKIGVKVAKMSLGVTWAWQFS